MKNFINSLMARLFPYIYKARSGVGVVRLPCLFDLAKTFFSFKRLEPWAFRMLDSSGKLTEGLLEGTSSALGDYDECLDVVIDRQNKKIKPAVGEYCLLEIKPPAPVVRAVKDFQINKQKSNYSLAETNSFLGFLRKVRTNPDHVMFRLGICMPSTCTASDIQGLVNVATKNVDLKAKVVRCESRRKFSLEAHEIVILSCIIVFMAFVVFGTIVNFINSSTEDAELESLEVDTLDSRPTKKRWLSSKFVNLCSKFSVSCSTQKLLECSTECDAFDVIRGIKVLTVLLAIFTHTYALPHPLHLYRFRSTLNFSKFIDQVLFGAIANSSVGVDTFFFLAGFICIYNRWRLLKRPIIGYYILKFILITYMRMVCAQVLVVGLFFLSPLFGSGPLWEEFVEVPLNNCRDSWWMNLLFIQNFLGPYDSCLYHTWVLATMMQIFISTAVIVWIMNRWPVIGILSNIAAILIAAIAVAIVTVVYQFPATFSIYFYDYRTSIKLWKYLYVQAYNHLGPQCIGMLTAYLIADHSSRKFNKHVALLLWVAVVVTFCSIIFGLHSYRDGQEMARGLAVFYSAVHRPVWAFGVGWIIYACATGHGGIVNSILSWKALVPFERLCYLAYLIHIPIMYFQGGVQRERMFMGHFSQVMCFLSYAVTSFVLSYVCYLLFQGPYEVIEGFIFRKSNG